MSLNLTPLAKLPPPLDGYTLVERLGRGGFGEVWKAEAPGGLLKAIKFVFGDLEADDEEENRSARQEEKALKRVKNIRHPYILSLERYDIIDGQLVIVMELADKNLWDRFRECHALGMPGIPREELLRYMEETAEALDLMNNHYKLQHLDVKPQNLFLVFNHVKVGDFGLAKVLEGVRGTITGGVTPVYAGPETFNGDISRFTDQYSLAIVYQEMLTGKRPFNGSTTKQLVMQHLTGQPDLEPLPPQDRAVIARGLAKEPEQRWPSCLELVKALRQSQAETIAVSARAATIPQSAESSSISSRITQQRTVPALTRRATAGPPPPVAPTPGFTSAHTSGLAPGHTPGHTLGPMQGPAVTPLPALVVPKLNQPPAVSNSTLTPVRTPYTPTAKLSKLPPVRREGGVLVPAIIVGLGGTGLSVLEQFRQTIVERFGSVEAAGHIRLVYIDTDPAAVAEANGRLPLAPHEVVLARLHRPGHYIQNEALPAVEQWMPPGMLYRLPRDARSTEGVRAFGRLALLDHHRVVVQRIHEQLDALADDARLDEAARATGLGVRSNRPRVILAASLAGGTGSGMAIDLACILRREIEERAGGPVDCTGLFFVPPIEGTHQAALANTYAALLELQQLQEQGLPATRYDPAAPPVPEPRAPFRRIALFQVSAAANSHDLPRAAGLAARAMFLELFTPVGQCCDEVRSEAERFVAEAPLAVVQPLGLYRLSWPRGSVLAVASRRLLQRLLDRWAAKDGSHLRGEVTARLDEQWARHRLALEDVVARFQTAVREHLQADADHAFAAMVEPHRPQATSGRLTPVMAAEVIQNLVLLVGKPDDEEDERGQLHGVLAAAAKNIAREAEQILFRWTGWFTEQPQFRLPGAEEAIAQILERIDRTLAALEGTQADLRDEVNKLYDRILTLLGNLGNAGRGVIGLGRSTIGTELLNSGTQFAKKRLMLATLAATMEVFRSMANVLTECRREAQDVRRQLHDVSQSLTADAATLASPGPGRMILPEGVKSLEEAADMLLDALPAQEVQDFEHRLQELLNRRCNGMIGLATRPGPRSEMVAHLLQTSREFLDQRMEASDPAAIFFRHKEDAAKMKKLLLRAYEYAAPGIAGVHGQPPLETTILACPESEDGQRLRATVQELLPDVRCRPARLADDIVFYRECLRLPIRDLPQLGPLACAAYNQHHTLEHSPHTRADIRWTP